MLRARRSVKLAARFSVSARLAKNPYYIYDLIKSQPKPPDTATFSPYHMVFDTRDSMAPENSARKRAESVFGTLASREASRKEAEQKAITVLGIKIPAPPEEPTNCCMSGCVNCVWELYKDEITERKELVNQARSKLMSKEHADREWPVQLGPEPKERRLARGAQEEEVASAKNDGASAEPTETNTSDSPSIGVGIEVFIETEKRIRARKEAKAKQRAAAAAHQ